MSFARFSANCDVYVFPTGPPPNNYCCMGCSLLPAGGPEDTFTETALEMIAHLDEHRAAGDKLPEAVFVRLHRSTP